MTRDPSDTYTPSVLPEPVVERVADRFRMLGDPTRLRLVNALHADGELAVGELVERLGLSYGAVSKQLALLRSHGLLSRRRDGNRIFYRIADPSLDDLCGAVCKSLREDWAAWGADLERDVQEATG